MKKYLWMLSAAVVIGALRVNSVYLEKVAEAQLPSSGYTLFANSAILFY